MSKQEVIRKAWEHYGIPLGQYIDENGWMNMLALTPDFIDDIRIKIEYRQDGFRDFQFGSGKYRPKSLQGIENNNGWIKIESEADLPISNGIYWTLRVNSIVPLYKEIFNDMDNQYWLDNYTHYQPITKPLKPIY